MIETIELKEGVTATIEDKTLKINGLKGQTKREFSYPGLKILLKNNAVIVETEKDQKKMKKMIKTWAAHIKNMIRGAEQGFTYKLKIASSHFPMSVNVKDGQVIIKNFVGEKKDRKARIVEGAEARVEGGHIIVESPDREKAGQTAANIEKATRIRGKDRRVFMDGIYITQKPGRQL